MTPRWNEDTLIDASGIAAQDLPPGALYAVATPVGNAADITLRALWVLSKADAIFAEDTRVTRPLLTRFGIDVPVIAAHMHNERAAADAICLRLAAGERVALVTDAGTPALSDPGALIVRAVRAAGHRVVPVPGASSLLAAVSAAGFADTAFRFLGFAPHGAGARATWLSQAAARGDAFFIFESPHRVQACLGDLALALAPERVVLIAREITKSFETIISLRADALAAWSATHEPRGEYVIGVEAAGETPSALDESTLRWLDALAPELPAARLAAITAKVTGVARDVAYAALMARKGSRIQD